MLGPRLLGHSEADEGCVAGKNTGSTGWGVEQPRAVLACGRHRNAMRGLGMERLRTWYSQRSAAAAEGSALAGAAATPCREGRQ
jgi:hypothetical protein